MADPKDELEVPEPPWTPESELPPTMIADGAQDYGDGMRNLPERLQRGLWELRLRYEGQADNNRSRREYVKAGLKLHEFFRGNQWAWWDYTTGSWRSTTASTGGQLAQVPYGQSQSLYVMNIFRPFVLSVISLIVGNRQTVKARPDDPNRQEDMEATQAANVVLRVHEKFERMHDTAVRIVFGLCVWGTIGSYVRTVVDGERWGYIDQPQEDWQDEKQGPDRFSCPICKDDLHDENDFAQAKKSGQPWNCKSCGAPLSEQPDIPAPVGPVRKPQVGQDGKPVTKRIPRGRTVRTVVDGAELKLPPEAAEQSEFPFLIRSREVDKAIPRSTYPEIADKISGASTSADVGTSSEFERRIRRQMTHGVTVEGRNVITDERDRITLTECWFRPRAFYQIDDIVVRQQLLSLFPGGCKIVWANDTFCEVRPESMDDHWDICHAMPGRGQIRDGIFRDLISVQEIANDLLNIIRDTIEYTLPVTFISTRVLDVRKWARSQVVAGATYNVVETGRPVSEGFYQTQPARLPEFATQLLTQLRTEIAQFIIGAFPAAYGGGTPGNSTAQGIEIERQSALGRINLFLQRIREHNARVGALIVNDFKNNAIEPVSYVDELDGGDLVLHTVSPEDFELGSFRGEFEMAEEFPTTWAQKQALLLQMFQMPAFAGWLGMLKNLLQIKTTLGTDLYAPGEEAYKREFQLIAQLLQGEPQPGQPQPIPGQIGPDGQPAMGPAQPKASIPVNPLDDNPTMLQADMDFYFSERGRAAMEKGGPGWENFMAHVMERQAAIPAPAPPPMKGGGGGATPGPPGPPPGGQPALPPGGPPGGQPALPAPGGPVM